jgi:hypothetical protein
MKTAYYFRSEIMTFSELSDEQKLKVIADSSLDTEQLEEDSFVVNPSRKNEEILSLGMFMKLDKPGVWHGVFGQTNSSAYMISLSKCASEAVVAYKYC